MILLYALKFILNSVRLVFRFNKTPIFESLGYSHNNTMHIENKERCIPKLTDQYTAEEAKDKTRYTLGHQDHITP